MNDRKQDIDRLLGQNTEEQLARVDWTELSALISSRLDLAERRKRVAIVRSWVFKTAAGIVVAAAVILITMMPKSPPEGGLVVEPGRYAAVDINPGRSRLVRCEVRIIDTNGEQDKQASKATWIIIKKSPEPVYADNGARRDKMATLFMF